ncbi:Crp/Fnr family transcriptional regulator [Actinokineospora auranticolor]|uniref:CRP-like cAMP-binding protein n=1 Tax=Actinokineospora auranticolor TaxID=155976 RepID=A0A2S6GZ14_9PSEU|nr:Crp/Fnr family transcriptional regulator [Actinokineospora auranticolor]PPK70406.1 CRP-like cAMP-binding protein [Actinokineospora auranticolor]
MTGRPQPPGSWLRGTFLARLDTDTRGELLRLGTSRTISAGASFITQGMHGSDVFLLRAPTGPRAAFAKVSGVMANGSETLLAIRVAGDVVGEGAMFHADGTRSATVTACADIAVQSIARDTFLGFLSTYPKAYFALCALISECRDFANRRRLDFAAYSVKARLARVIFELLTVHGVPHGHGKKLGIELSQEELGKLVGAKPDSARDAMRRLRAEGLVQVRYRGVSAPDLDALLAAAEMD